MEIATTFKSMYAYGNHFRVMSSEMSRKTADSGVAATFRQVCRSGIMDDHEVTADVEYVGHIEEILELNYRRHCVVVLVCDFVKANYAGQNATVKRDKWGFTLVNYNRRPGIICQDSFAFPKHCEQVFYSNAREAPGWKVVLRNEVRSRRVLTQNEGNGEARLFDMGEDDDFEGLRPEKEVGEGPLPTVPSGHNVVVQEILRPRRHRSVVVRGRPRGRGRASGRGVASEIGGRGSCQWGGCGRAATRLTVSMDEAENDSVAESNEGVHVFYDKNQAGHGSVRGRSTEGDGDEGRRRVRQRSGSTERNASEETNGEYEGSSGRSQGSLSPSSNSNDLDYTEVNYSPHIFVF